VVAVLIALIVAFQFYLFTTLPKELFGREEYETTAARISTFRALNPPASPSPTGIRIMNLTAATISTFHASNPPASPSPAEIRIMNLTDRLGTQKLRYFMYTNKGIEQAETKELLRKGKGSFIMGIPQPVNIRYRSFARDEVMYLESLKNHKLRTRDSSKADLFVLPLSPAAVLCQPNSQANFEKAFAALYATPLFKSTLGHRHVIMGTILSMFSPFHVRIMEIYGIGSHYPRLWNVTVANDMDPEEMRKVYKLPGGNTSDFNEGILEKLGYVSRSTFSVGLAAPQSLPIVMPTLEKFQKASFFAFYHTRTKPYLFNSTKYRSAPLQERVVEGLPKSSIGFDLHVQEWMLHFKDSKFCLIIRGDTPSTHSLLSAVRVGCIPVIICDLCSSFSPSLKSSLTIEDFSVSMDEKRFLQNPLGELLKLQEITDFEIEEKLKWLAYAQRITQPDHPQSLFVPAFIYESLEAYKRQLDVSEYADAERFPF
jgi:hypothetical protein